MSYGCKRLISTGDASELQKVLEKREQKKMKTSKSKSKGTPLLHWATIENQVVCCVTLLEHNFNINEKEYKTGYTPLHYAAEKGFFDIADLLIKRKADINSLTASGYTALHLAMIHGHEDILDLLLDEGVNVEQKTSSGRNVLHLAPGSSVSIEFIEDLFESVSSTSVSYMLNRPSTDNEWTPLHHACDVGSQELIKIYIEHGADVRLKTKDGTTTEEIMLRRIEREKLNEEDTSLYQQSIRSIKFLSLDYFTQSQINRVLKTKYPAIDLHACGLTDNTFFYRVLQMLELKQKQKFILDATFNSSLGGVAPFLTHLDLSYNSLTVIPVELKQIVNLQWFNVSHNHLKALPINMGLYKNLKYLDISHNELTMLPSSFAELRNHKTNEIKLAELHLQGNDLEVPPKRVIKQGIPAIIDFFAELLEGEDETCKKISIACVGPTETGKSSLLRCFMPKSRNRSSSILSRLASKSNIQAVKEETENPIDFVSFQLKGSVTRALSDSGTEPIQVAKEMLCKKKNLSHSMDISDHVEILWEKFTNKGPFHDFLKQGQAKAFNRYFLASEFITWWLENSPITSRKDGVLIGVLFEQAGLIRHPDKKQTFVDQSIPYIICAEETAHIEIEYKAMDFSAKAVEMNIPVLYVNACSIVIIVFDARKKFRESGVHYWLDMVRNHCANDKVIIMLVATHLDGVDQMKINILLKSMADKYCDAFPQIKCITAVSTLTRDGITRFGETLFEHTKTILKAQGRIPAKFTALRNSIYAEAQREVPTMFIEEYQQIGSLFSLHDKQLYDATRFLLQTGAIFYQPSDFTIKENGELQFKSFFCLSPLWLAQCLSVLEREQKTQIADGIVSIENLEQIWSQHSVPNYLVRPLINLFAEKNILYPFPDTFKRYLTLSTEEIQEKISLMVAKMKKSAGQPRLLRRASGSMNVFGGIVTLSSQVLIPHFVPTEYNKELYNLLWPETTSFDQSSCHEYARTWKFSFMQDALWNRLFKQLLLSADAIPLYWKKGVLLCKGEVTACVERFSRARLIVARVRAPSETPQSQAFEFFRTIISMMKSLTQYWFDDENVVEILAPCPHCLTFFGKINENNSHPPFHRLHAFSLHECTAAVRSGKGFLVCPRVYKPDKYIKSPTSARSDEDMEAPVPEDMEDSSTTKLRKPRFHEDLKIKSKHLLHRKSHDLTSQLNYSDEIFNEKPTVTVREKRGNSEGESFGNPLARRRMTFESRSVSSKVIKEAKLEGKVPSLEMRKVSPISSPLTGTNKTKRRSKGLYPIQETVSSKDFFGGLSPRKRKNRSTISSAPDLNLEIDPLPLRSKIPLHYEELCPENEMFHVRIRLEQLVPDIALVDLCDVRVEQEAIEIQDLLGKGAFGDVHSCIYKGQKYAAKKLSEISEESFDEFSKEVALMSKLKHPNLVNLICFCTDPFMIVMELITHGELYTFLHSAEAKHLDWRLRVRIAIDIGRGMSFLHSLTPPIIHRDLKSPNILLTSYSIPSSDILTQPIAKISDFGLSTHLFAKMKQSTARRDVQTPTWLAPEVLRAEPYGEKSDCYAMGIVMWELLVPGNHPFDEFGFGSFISKQEEAIMSGVRPSIPDEYRKFEPYYYSKMNTQPNPIPRDECARDIMKMEYLRVMTACWAQSPTKRPSFLQILFKLSSAYKKCYQI